MIAKIYPNNHPDIADREQPVRYFDIRKLTEAECLKLMGVDHDNITKLVDNPKLARSSVYKLAGNSIVVDCMYYIFKQVYGLGDAEPSNDLFAEPIFKTDLPDTIRMVTLCSGYDSQLLAMDRFASEVGRKTDLVWWSEYDPDNKKPIDEQPAVIAHNSLFPQYSERNLGDMTKIDWDKVDVQGEIDWLTYSTPCFVCGTLIHTQRGLIPIESVTTEDNVLTHTNQWRKVVELMAHRHIGGMIKLRTMMTEEIRCTDNHPFYARKRYRRENKRFFEAPTWISAKKLTKDYYLGYPINQSEKYPEWKGVIDNRWGHHKISNKLSLFFPNKYFWYLMGRYIGDGWKRESKYGNSIIICYSDRNKDAIFAALENLEIHYNVEECRTANKIHIHSNEMFEFVDRYGYYAHGKRIDRETLDLPKFLLEAFLDGYMDSDGCTDGKHRKITTVSRELAYNLMECVAKVYHAPSKLYYCKRPKQTVIEGRVVNQRDTFSITWKQESNKQDKAFYEDGFIWYPIREVQQYNDDVFVYNMEVEEDHSYIANNAIVHNCQSISNSGLRHGMAKGSGTRSAILWYTEAAIRKLRPKFLLQENVKAMIGKKNVADFNEWQKVVEDCGYTNYYTVMNAKDYGIPQNRERVFMLSVRKDLNLPTFVFPKPFPLAEEVADYLDDVTDTKYYLQPEAVIKFLQFNEEDKSSGIRYVYTDKKLTNEQIKKIQNGSK